MGAVIAGSMLLAALADAAWNDVRSFRIPNRAPAIAALGVLPLAAAQGWGAAEFGLHLAAGLAVLAAGTVLLGLNLWGGGDAKLLAAVALWTGFPGLTRLLLVTAIAGGFVAAAALAAPRLPALRGWGERCRAERGVSYGLAIAAGGFDWWASQALRALAS